MFIKSFLNKIAYLKGLIGIETARTVRGPIKEGLR